MADLMNLGILGNKLNVGGLLDLDWTKKPYIFLLSFLFIISRVPLLNLGFGSDPDAWRVADSAFDLHYFNIYHPSRFPGYPLYEFFNSLIINYGWLATNIATMIISLISVFIFAKILKELDIKNKGLLVVTYVFLPILWINSASTMDYMWALTFILFTWFFIIKKQYFLAGLMMGLAIGSRITSVALILPFLYLILAETKNVKNAIYYSVTASVTAIILFLPLFLQYGLNFLTYYPSSVNIIAVGLIINYFLGILAVSFGLMLLALSFKSLLNNVLRKDNLTLFLLFLIGIILILFIKAPYEVAYLIPAIPFSLILISNISKRTFFAVLCILLISNAFISFPSLNSSNIAEEGIIMHDIEIRSTILQMQILIDSNMNNSVIITGEYLPAISYYLFEESARNNKLMGIIGDNNVKTKEQWNFRKNVGYIYSAPLDKIKELQKEGYKIYYIGNSTRNMINNLCNYDLNNYNAMNILV